MTPRELGAYLEALARDGDRGERELAARLVRHCWPAASEGDGGAARRWLVRWRPRRSQVAVTPCACASGRCGLCN